MGNDLCSGEAGGTIPIGQFALALAITAPVLMLTNMWLRAVQATDTSSEFEFATTSHCEPPRLPLL